MKELNSYSDRNQCRKCGKVGEVIYHQYLDAYSCQLCGGWFEDGEEIGTAADPLEWKRKITGFQMPGKK
jgi:hypothetical protein